MTKLELSSSNVPAEIHSFLDRASRLEWKDRRVFDLIKEITRRPLSSGGLQPPPRIEREAGNKLQISYHYGGESWKFYAIPPADITIGNELRDFVVTELTAWFQARRAGPAVTSASSEATSTPEPLVAGCTTTNMARVNDALTFFKQHPELLDVGRNPDLMFEAERHYREAQEDGFLIEHDGHGLLLRPVKPSTPST